MANYTFSRDLIDDALFRCGESTDGSSDYETAALRYLNRAYQALWMGGAEIDPTYDEIWWWLFTKGILTLEGKITAGTVSVTKNSTSITFSTPPAPLLESTVTDWFFRTDDSNGDTFQIAQHTAASATATLDSVYTDENSGTKTYRLFKLDYPLASDLLHLAEPMEAYQTDSGKIQGGAKIPRLLADVHE